MEVKEAKRAEREFDVRLTESDVRMMYAALYRMAGIGGKPRAVDKINAKVLASEMYHSFPLDKWGIHDD